MSADKQDVEAFMDLARVKLTGASDAGIKANLYEVLTEFFRESWSWIEDITFSVAPGQLLYQIQPSEGQIIALAGVVDPINTPQPATMADPGQIQLINSPNIQQGSLIFTATVVKTVVRPNQRDDFPVIPADTLRIYHDVVMDGLCGKMMLEPNKSYSNETVGLYSQRKFKAGIVTAKLDAMRRRTIGAQNWRFPQTFRVRGQKGGISVGNNTGFI